MADAAQIEARGTAWISGQDDLTEAFRQDRDVYSEFAGEVLAAPVRKPRRDDPPPVARLYGGRRAIGKVGILGMGYGMGFERAFEYMQTYPELATKIEAGEIDLMFCKRVVDTYRNKYRMIPTFWRNIENAFRFTTKYGQPQMLRGLEFSHEGTTTRLTLPSGRTLFYPHASLSTDERLRWHWGDLWGGTLTENVVQAMSRDLLADAILFVEDHGFHIAHHCYDSLVVCVPEAQQTVAFACVCEAFTQNIPWCPGWPMGVDATVGRHYD
jgi:DNA polymerase